MNVQQFRYALEIYNCRSMNKAAQRLFITQPALSQSIRDLEKETADMTGILLSISNTLDDAELNDRLKENQIKIVRYIKRQKRMQNLLKI